jgi:transcriptional regulator with XRE-family HTH domain
MSDVQVETPGAAKLPPRVYFRQLGKRLTQLRKDREFTQAEVARVLGVAQQTVFAIELGDRRVRVDWVPKLARLYGVTTDELLSISSAVPPMPKQKISPAMVRHAATIGRLGRGERSFILKLAEHYALRRNLR